MSNQFLDANGLYYYNKEIDKKFEDCVKENQYDNDLQGIYHELTDVDERNQDNLLKNLHGSSDIIWAVPRNGYRPDGKKNTGLPIGSVKFDKSIYLEVAPPEFQTIADITQYTGKIVTDFTFDNLSGSNTDKLNSTAVLARVAQMWEVSESNPNLKYSDFIRATGNGSNSISFYWVGPQYCKRVSAEEGSGTSATATSSGASVGIVSMSNYFTKWANGEINSTDTSFDTRKAYADYLIEYYQAVVSNSTLPTLKNAPKFPIFNATDNEEPGNQTMAVRNGNGNLLVNSSTPGSLEAIPDNYFAVNNKELKQVVSYIKSHTTSSISSNAQTKFTTTYTITKALNNWIPIAQKTNSQAFGRFEIYAYSGNGGSEAYIDLDALSIENRADNVQLKINDSIFRYTYMINGVRINHVCTGTDSNGKNLYTDYLEILLNTSSIKDGGSSLKVIEYPIISNSYKWTQLSELKNQESTSENDKVGALVMFNSKEKEISREVIIDSTSFKALTQKDANTIYFVKE